MPPAELTFPLSRGIEVGGTIVDSNSQPIANARIAAEIRSTAPRGRPRHTASGYEAISNSEGKWVLSRLPKQLSRVNLKVLHDEYISDPTFWKRSFTGDELNKLHDREYVAVLREGVNVSGLVTDSSGAPVAGAIVSMGDDMRADHPDQPVTDSDGTL